MTPLRIGTRGSALARWQAEYVAGLLRPLITPRPVELVPIRTEGDVNQTASLTDIGGRGVFTKAIQRSLLAGTVDVAVHSLKDLPTEPFDGLTLAAVPPRGPAGDVLVARDNKRLDDLSPGARVATGSVRRRALLMNRRPDLSLADIRGNVDTRLRKLDEHDLDAIVLARAGLERLGLIDRITEDLDTTWMVPAVGQGALGLECRVDDLSTVMVLSPLSHYASHVAVLAERAFLRALGGGCQVPIGACATVAGDELTLRGVVLADTGLTRVDGTETGRTENANELGERLANRLLASGADLILNR